MLRFTLKAQALFYVATGAWPLIDIDSFLAATGPKEDIWLVHTVGALLALIGGVLYIGALQKRLHAETLALAFGTAIALIAIDVIYVQRGVIAPIYLADALVESMVAAALLIGWRVYDREPTPRLVAPRQRRA